MKRKITNLAFTLSALIATTYAAYIVGLSTNKVEVVEVEEYGLNNPDANEVKLQELIKTYEVEYPQEVPWKTCVQ